MPDFCKRHDFFKYHGLGNDYLVIEPARFAEPLTPAMVRRICDRHRGVGSDGILYGPAPGAAPPAVRIYNPDGSESAKSGNGLRIFARHLHEHGHLHAQGHVQGTAFYMATSAGPVQARLLDEAGHAIAVSMGRVRFDSAAIPMTGAPREVVREALAVDGRHLTITAATIGNPHCVIPVAQPTPEMARELGPLVEHHPAFPERTNVQFMAVRDRHAIRIEIWERGAGYTLASGSSSCAAAAAACRLGLCESPVTVHMPGGTLTITLDRDYHAEMEGPVAAVHAGDFSDELLAELGLRRQG